MTHSVIQATSATGSHAGKTIFIPKIPMKPSDSLFPFKFTRRQFPIRPSFAITINKSQGQTLKQAGVYLERPVFTHGQLYVAMSRVGSPTALRIMTISSKENPNSNSTKNVVYKEPLH
jgi:hypothetical protein